MTLMRRTLGFVGLPILSSVAPFVLLPVVARVAGNDGWAAISVGQSIGLICALIVGTGWDLIGPAKIARVNVQAHHGIYTESLRSRGLVFLALVPICFTAPWMVIESHYQVESSLMAVAAASTGLMPSWYAIAIGKPKISAVYEILPRLGVSMIALVVVLSTSQLIFYPIAGIASSTLVLTLFSLRVHTPFGVPRRPTIKVVLSNWKATTTVFVAGAYSSATVLIVALFSDGPNVVAQYASGELIYKIGLMGLSAVASALMSWVLAESNRYLFPRALKSISVIAFVGVLGAIFICICGSWVSSLLLGSALAMTTATASGFAVAFFAISLNTVFGRHFLVPLGKVRGVFQSTLWGAILGVPLIVAGTIYLGAAGAAWGLAVSEVIVTFIQGVSIIRISRYRSKIVSL